MKQTARKGKPPALATQRQALVDRVFAECMRKDERTLDEIRAAVRTEIRREGMRTGQYVFGEQLWQPTDHELQIMVSRNAMGEGEWEYWPAYTRPPRYVSRRRAEELAEKMEAGKATEREVAKLKQMLEDMHRGVAHWRGLHRSAILREGELTNLIRNVSNRAFRGHYGELL